MRPPFPIAVTLMHWTAVDLHRLEAHAGSWHDCQRTVCTEARAALHEVGYGPAEPEEIAHV